MSDKETNYAREFFVLSGSHLKSTAANHLPEAFASIVRSAGASAAKDLVPAPCLDRHVFCRVLEDRGHVTVDEEGWVIGRHGNELMYDDLRPVRSLACLLNRRQM